MFQSLFQWKVLCNYNTSIAILQMSLKFQSLFQWKVLCNQFVRIPILQRSCQFQSLFQWKVLCNGDMFYRAASFNQSFNPCFSGRYSAMQKETLPSRHLRGFQSLFQWKVLCNQTVIPTYRWVSKFQSLFQWKVLCNGDV